MIEIHSLWIGKLSTLERLCITSHLEHGHEYHLWTYEPMEVPDGVILENGNDVLPESTIFTYKGPLEKGGGSVSAFSNLFRYKLLSEREVWWCDTDVVCLKPWKFDSYVVATEFEPCGTLMSTTCVIRVSQETAAFCYEIAKAKDPEKVEWGEIGPSLYHSCVLIQEFERYQVAPETFCPVHWWEFEKLFKPAELDEGCYGVHLWNEMWRRDQFDKDGIYLSNSLYESLRTKYLGPVRRPIML